MAILAALAVFRGGDTKAAIKSKRRGVKVGRNDGKWTNQYCVDAIQQVGVSSGKDRSNFGKGCWADLIYSSTTAGQVCVRSLFTSSLGRGRIPGSSTAGAPQEWGREVGVGAGQSHGRERADGRREERAKYSVHAKLEALDNGNGNGLGIRSRCTWALMLSEVVWTTVPIAVNLDCLKEQLQVPQNIPSLNGGRTSLKGILQGPYTASSSPSRHLRSSHRYLCVCPKSLSPLLIGSKCACLHVLATSHSK